MIFSTQVTVLTGTLMTSEGASTCLIRSPLAETHQIMFNSSDQHKRIGECRPFKGLITTRINEIPWEGPMSKNPKTQMLLKAEPG